ncbi:MAG TPA: hypothetical protein VFU01_02500 [Gemmatimonadaceae bacterium]|nr:hypothetical protein [Gemmatimonadaceae bacterium]
MLTGLLGKLRKTVTLTVTPQRFSFASPPREAAIDATVRVSADGRIVGFGDSGPATQGQLRPVFSPGASGAVTANEQALVALCRRGFALVLGQGLKLRPRAIVRGAERCGVPKGIFTRVLREAGAETVEFID